MAGIISEFIEAVLSSLLDPNPVGFRASDERGVAPVRAACRGRSETPQRLQRPLNRNAFLRGVLDVTEQEAIEHLVIGFGKRLRSTTRVETIAHGVGSARQVSIPAGLWNAMDQWLAGHARGEVVLAHSHPRNALNILLDNVPLASGADRDAWLRALLQGKRIRCYLVENGFVREFRTPMLLRLLDRITRKTQPAQEVGFA